jgi:hypothetical protein
MMIKYKFLRVILTFTFGAAALWMSSCASSPSTFQTPVINISTNEEAEKYKLALVEAIQSSDKIVIREQSNKIDFFELIPDLNNAPQYTYALKELNTGEKILFLASARNLKGGARTMKTDCLFVAHHTIEFYEGGILKSSMEVCYKCSDVKWSASEYDAPQDIFQALTPVITSAGMQTHRPWDEMAKLRYEEENQVRPDPVLNPDRVPTAKWALGQKGKKVINPFTGKIVDVEGIPANTKVRDPNDKNPTHIFRVPGV